MAILLNSIPTNITEYPNSFKRQGAFPLDAHSIFYSVESAKEYASTNPLAYVGQVISVVDNGVCELYIIKDEDGTIENFAHSSYVDVIYGMASTSEADITYLMGSKADEFDTIEIDGGYAQNAIDGNW